MTTPYSEAARAYYEAGWSPIPLPFEEKSPPPSKWAGKPQMFTGVGGAYVTEEHLKVWLSKKGRAQAGKLSFAPSNIALRLPEGVIGIDVDAYGEKQGGQTLAAAEEEWGALPPTWVSTSKDDGVSGIRLFRIPPGLAWPGQLPQGGGVELIRWDHRFIIVAPSIHDKTKRQYKWYRETVREDGSYAMVLSVDEFPDAPPEGGEVDPETGLPVVDLANDAEGESDIPWLPQEWVDGLTAGQEWVDRGVDESLDAKALNKWLAERNDPDAPCSHMRKMLTRWSVSVQKAADDGGAHDEMRDAIWGALNDAKAGHSGIIKVLGHLRSVFLKAVEGRRPDPGAAQSEWARTVLRGGQKVTADDNEPEEEDPCESLTGKGSAGEKRGKQQGSDSGSGSSGRGSGSRGSGGTSMEDPGQIGSRDIEPCNEKGNGNRLVRVMNGRARWVDAYGCWYLWDTQQQLWRADDDRQVDRWVVKAVDGMDEEMAFLEGEEAEKQIKAFKAHQKSSYSKGNREAMKDMVKGRKGIMLPAKALDAEPRHLACSNGTVELGDDGVKFRPTRPEDYATLNTGTRYVEGARHALWDSYLEKFFPDEEVRTWLQRLVGYSLLGDNSEQLMIVGLGRTGSGKTTFVEGLYAALGSYSGPLDASVLRGSSDDKPRPDILKVMPKRLVIAEELSEFQNLHVDQMKRITGAGTLSARGMNSNVFLERRGAFTPWIMTNDVPTIEGADAALRNRVLVVPFDVQQPRNRASSRIRESIIVEAREAILAWAVEGWVQYVTGDNDLREIPAGALAANGRFTEGMSVFHAFLAACVDTGEDFHELPQRLFEAYETWCIESGIPERERLSMVKFGKRMNAIGTELKRYRPEPGAKQIWHRYGVRLTV